MCPYGKTSVLKSEGQTWYESHGKENKEEISLSLMTKALTQKKTRKQSDNIKTPPNFYHNDCRSSWDGQLWQQSNWCGKTGSRDPNLFSFCTLSYLAICRSTKPISMKSTCIQMTNTMFTLGCHIKSSMHLSFKRRQIIRYRATNTLRRLPIKQ